MAVRIGQMPAMPIFSARRFAI